MTAEQRAEKEYPIEARKEIYTFSEMNELRRKAYVAGFNADRWHVIVEGDGSTFPEDGMRVLLSTDHYGTQHGYLKNDGTFYIYGFLKGHAVSKWQELPKP